VLRSRSTNLTGRSSRETRSRRRAVGCWWCFTGYSDSRLPPADPHGVVRPGESVQPLWLWDLRPLQTPQGRSLDSFVIEEGVRS